MLFYIAYIYRINLCFWSLAYKPMLPKIIFVFPYAWLFRVCSFAGARHSCSSLMALSPVLFLFSPAVGFRAPLPHIFLALVDRHYIILLINPLIDAPL